MGFTSDACWFLLLKSLLIKDNKKRQAALKNEAGGRETCFFFYLALPTILDLYFRKTLAGKSRVYRDAIVFSRGNLSFVFKMFSAHNK